MPSISILFSLTYVVLLLVSISMFDAATKLDSRIMLPAFIFVILGLISVPWAVSQVTKHPLIWWCFVLLALVSVGSTALKTARAANTIHRNGSGYNSRQWNSSATLSLLHDLSENLKIYSNGPDVILFQTNRDSVTIPAHTDPTTTKLNRRYQERIELLCQEVASGQALVVYLDNIDWRLYLPTEEELQRNCALPVYLKREDGTIYRADHP